MKARDALIEGRDGVGPEVGVGPSVHGSPGPFEGVLDGGLNVGRDTWFLGRREVTPDEGGFELVEEPVAVVDIGGAGSMGPVVRLPDQDRTIPKPVVSERRGRRARILGVEVDGITRSHTGAFVG